MKRFLILFLLAGSLPVGAATTTVEFHYGPVKDDNVPECPKGPGKAQSPFTCEVNIPGGFDVGLTSWGKGRTATITYESETEEAEITGPCADRVIQNKDSLFVFNLSIDECPADPDTGPPPATGTKIFDKDCPGGEDCPEEWYTDLPWHQKLSTQDSNLIDVPFVLPYKALSTDFRDKGGVCEKRGLSEERCMLRYGIVDVMGMQRTDTLYKKDEGPTPEDCHDPDDINPDANRPCVELKLRIQRFNTQTDDPPGYQADEIGNNPGPGGTPPSRGFAINDATIFAPWRNWYQGHFCAKLSDNVKTGVCYDDYWTTGLQAAASSPENWLTGAWNMPSDPTPFKPALFWPRGKDPTLVFANYCQEGKTECNMVLGKVDWLEDATAPKVTGCMNDSDSNCEKQLKKDTCDLDCWLAGSLMEFQDRGAYPWTPPEFPTKCTVTGDPDDPVYECDTDAFPNDLSTGEEKYNPFIGFYEVQASEEVKDRGGIWSKYRYKSPEYVLPKKCTKEDYRDARTKKGDIDSINRLSDCAVNIEIHSIGFHDLWKDLYGGALSDKDIGQISEVLTGLGNNQYGRTMFLFAGVREQQVVVSFETIDDGMSDDSMSIHDKVYSGGPYVQYLPMVNPADTSLEWKGLYNAGKNYAKNFWRAFFMSNHMNQDPDHFIRGIRGRTLWHNEYRSNLMYQAWFDKRTTNTKFDGVLGHRDFPAGFPTGEYGAAPFHGNTCDSCHIRNGSGIPLMPDGQLPQPQRGCDDLGKNCDMKAVYSVTADGADYTYTNGGAPKQNQPVMPPMKLVFFDVDELPPTGGSECDDDDHTVGLTEDDDDALAVTEDDEGYHTPIMSYFGNSLALNQHNSGSKPLVYGMKYVAIKPDDGFVVVDGSPHDKYTPKRVEITDMSKITVAPKGQKCGDAEGCVCGDGDIKGQSPDNPHENWPKSCDEVRGAAIKQAIDDGKIGFMLLNGRRLGNTPLIEMVPDAEILGAQERQKQDPDMVAGCVSLAPGTRRGQGVGEASYNYRSCSSRPAKRGDGPTDCYIGRWGWIGDRASLEDQVANAAIVEMGITSSKSFEQIHTKETPDAELVRYTDIPCGPANAYCESTKSVGNSDILEQEIRDMATYQRWIGIPNRSEYQVADPLVQAGEKIFKDLGCNSCHVIRKIPFVYDDNMLPDEERDYLSEREILDDDGNVEYPYVAYLGTDLLMHDMGYLSQVAPVPDGAVFRDPETGKVVPGSPYRSYVQLIRTPALKGLRFNRFVTDSNYNTMDATHPLGSPNSKGLAPLNHIFTPGCDFLLHDGRACDAIEAAFLHDGPAVKALGMIETLNAWAKGTDSEKLKLLQLRAFLYSL